MLGLVILLFENSNIKQCKTILDTSAYHLTDLQVEYYEKNCKNN